MKNLSAFLLLASFMAFISCQKEIVLNNPSTDTTGGGIIVPPGTSGELVIKVYGKAPSGLDSNVSYYTYNSAKKVISRHIMIYAYGESIDTWSWYERNAAGLIIKSKNYQVNSTNPLPADTTVTFHNYNAGTNPSLQSSVSSTDFFGITISDSIAYTYNSSGRVAKSENFQNSFFSSIPELTGRNVFTYDANGNPAKIQLYSISSGVASLETTQTYTFDNKTDPLNYSDAEAFIISGFPPFKNNALSFILLNTASGATSANTTYTYTYNSTGKPATTKTTSVLTGPLAQTTVTNFTIYYQ